jgi:hypothetical protein
LRPVFLFPFRHRHLLLGHPVPLGNSAFFTVGLPGRMMRPGPQPGFTRSAHVRRGRGGCPLYPGAVVSLPAGQHPRPGTCAFQRPALNPATAFHLRGPKSRGINQGFNRSPVRPSSRPWSPGGTGTLRLSPELSTPPLPATHLGAKTGHTDTDPGLHPRHNRTSFVQPTHLVRPRVAMLPFGRPASASWAPCPAREFGPHYCRLTAPPAHTRAWDADP